MYLKCVYSKQQCTLGVLFEDMVETSLVGFLKFAISVLTVLEPTTCSNEADMQPQSYTPRLKHLGDYFMLESKNEGTNSGQFSSRIMVVKIKKLGHKPWLVISPG